VNYFIVESARYLPLSLNVLPPSKIFAHQPVAHGTVSTPFTDSIWVALNLKGSLQVPNSPLERQVKHRLSAPETECFSLHTYLLAGKSGSPNVHL